MLATPYAQEGIIRLGLLLLLVVVCSGLSTPLRNPTRPDFQTSNRWANSDFVVLFTGSSSNVSGTTATYRNETYVVTYTAGAIDTTNTVQVGLGIVRNYFDFSGSPFRWDLVIPSFTSTSMNIMVSANGTNKVTELAISYIVESSLLFQTLYAAITFAATDDVCAGTNADNNCGISSSNPTKACYVTSKTITYGGSVLLDTTQNPKVRLFITGVEVVPPPGNQNIGWQITATNTPGSLSFSVDVVAFENTQLNYIAFTYVLYQQTTITADIANVLLGGTVSFGCWLTNNAGNCNSAPDSASINSAGPTYTPYVYLLGFSSIYCTKTGGDTGQFNLSSTSVSGNNYNLVLYFMGNNNNDYKMKFYYLVYQQIGCAGYAVDKYLTVDRQWCNQTCNGGIGQYFDANNWCQNCDVTCYSCVSTSATCTACYNSQNRVLNGSICSCNPLGFYDDGTSLTCPACHYSCMSCTSSTFSSCTACNLTVQHRQLLGNACPCTTGYYENALPICATCHYSCWTCSASGSSSCLTCNSTVEFRYISANRCLCLDGYYDSGVAICTACHYTCLTCSGGSSSSSCTTCSSTANRYQSGSTCPCLVGYYDVGPTVMTCGACDPTCYTCNGPLNTNCLSCNASLNRGFVLNRCDCIAHYYQFGGTCNVCDYTCGNCTGGTNATCSSCISGNFRTLVSTSCPCNTGYYDAGIAGCLICNYACQSCSVSSTNCTACNASKHRTMAGNSCPCDGGYVNVLAAMCSPCSYTCLTCTSTLSTGCSSCAADRYLSGAQCLCLTHTYDNGVTEPCGTCHYSCLNCTNQYTTSCLSCTSTDLRTLSGTSCPCNARYYDAGIATCQPCYYTCLTCSSNTISTCLTCSAGDFRTIVGNQCLCNSHYYENGVTVCAMCAPTCLNCTAYSTCTACDAVSNFRVLSGGACICMNGYYDTGATVCAPCAYQCLTCVTISTNCLSCNTSAQRTLGSGTCLCNFGYYDSGVTMCTLCYYSCDSCSAGLINNCLTCNSTALRTLSGTSCVCPGGYYDNGSSEMCQMCYFKCLNCSSYSVCTACDATLYRTLALGACGCMAGYYDTNSPSCAPCYPTCVTCNGLLSTNCLTCSAAAFRTFSSFMCVCIAGYYEAGGNTCAACSYTCLNCTGTSTNCTSCNYTNLRSFVSGACPCNAGYFDNGAALCAPCDHTCATCTSTSTNCLSCNASQLTVLSGNICVCMSTAYLNTSNNVCYACNGYCLSCTTAGNLSCTSCSAALHRTLSGTTCLCTAGYYEAGIPLCGTCHTSCLTCFGGNTSYNCTSCYPGYNLFTSTCLPTINCANYYFDGQCINTCPSYTYPSAHVCVKCTNNCYTCTNATICLTCQSGYKFQPSNSTCNIACTQLQYELNGICYNCPSNCQSCVLIGGSVVCTSCSASYYFYQGGCVLNCPTGVTVLQSGSCIPCVPPCATCSGLSSQQCLTCVMGYTMLGNECLANCPVGMFSSGLTRYCEVCPSNCTACRQGVVTNSTYCTACISGLYPSNGLCITTGYFLDTNSNVVQCHPNCQTCTNSSFSSCIVCMPLRGDSSQQAILGYCDCQKGTIQLGNGVCDKALYRTISSANSFLVSSSASVFGTSLAVGVVTSNLVNFEKFMGYNQLISQYYYLNASVPASTDIVFQYLGMANVGNFLSNYGENQPLSRRVLFDNSTQSIDSLFLHRHTTYQIQTTCLHILIANGFVWVVIGLLTALIPFVEKRYKKKPTKCLSKFIKILKYWCSIFKYKIAVKVIVLTATEASFNVAMSLKLTDFRNLTTGDIVSFCLACVIGIFYLAVLVRMFVAACLIKAQDKKDPYYVLCSDFQPRQNYKWYRTIYVPMQIVRCLLTQLLIVELSYLAFYQGLAACSVQLVFLIYTLLCNPFIMPWAVCVYITEFLLAAQIAILTVITYVPESERLKYTFILIALNYAQMAVFGVFCLGSIMKMVYDAIVECRNKNRVYAEEVSESSHVSHGSDADNQKQIDDSLEMKQQRQQLEYSPQKEADAPSEQHDSQFELKDEEIPSVQDIQEEGVRIKKRYRVQRRRNVFDQE